MRATWRNKLLQSQFMVIHISVQVSLVVLEANSGPCAKYQAPPLSLNYLYVNSGAVAPPPMPIPTPHPCPPPPPFLVRF